MFDLESTKRGLELASMLEQMFDIIALALPLTVYLLDDQHTISVYDQFRTPQLQSFLEADHETRVLGLIVRGIPIQERTDGTNLISTLII